MRIEEIHPGEHVAIGLVDDYKEFKSFLRFGPDSWYELMGESYEPVWDCTKLEGLYQQSRV